MSKIKMVLVSVAIAIVLSITADYQKLKQQVIPIPEKIIETIVLVNNASGIVIHSDSEKSLVLTSKHVVDEKDEAKVEFVYFYKNMESEVETFISNKIEIDEESDLAIVEIDPGRVLFFSQISKTEPVLGDDVWVASNPNQSYRSLKKGIISSKERKITSYIAENNYMWEVSGGVIFGSSGGGIFNTDGNLVAVVSGVDVYMSNQCYDVFDAKLEWVGMHCVHIAIPYIGFVEPLSDIKDFLLKSSFKDHFEYLAEEE